MAFFIQNEYFEHKTAHFFDIFWAKKILIFKNKLTKIFENPMLIGPCSNLNVFRRRHADRQDASHALHVPDEIGRLEDLRRALGPAVRRDGFHGHLSKATKCGLPKNSACQGSML
jgi:hypothetical protein